MKTPPPGRQWRGGGEVGIKNVDKYFDPGHTAVAHTTHQNSHKRLFATFDHYLNGQIIETIIMNKTVACLLLLHMTQFLCRALVWRQYMHHTYN